MRFRIHGAAVDVGPGTRRLEGAILPQVGLANGPIVGQHADHDFGVGGCFGWCVDDLTKPELFRPLASSVPEAVYKSLAMQAEHTGSSHLPGATNCDLHRHASFFSA